MNSIQVSKRQFNLWICIIFGCTLTLIIILFWGKFFFQKHKKTNLLHLKKENWNGFVKIETEIEKLKQNLGKNNSRYQSDDLELKEFIQEEFKRQITEIQRISSVEISLKQAELDRIFSEYSNRRSKETEKEFEKRSAILLDIFNRDIQQKSLELDQKYKKYKDDLEKFYQLDLVNLQLQLSMMDFNPNKPGDNEAKNQLRAKMDRISQDITQKCQVQKEIFQKQFSEYKEQRQNQIKTELSTLKNDQKKSLEQELTNYQAILETEFKSWNENRKLQFEKAIQVRQGQKK